MRIHVGIPSRGRPLDLIAATLSLFRMASGNNQVRATIACDTDDKPTRDRVSELMKAYPIAEMAGPRPLGLGELHNKMCAATAKDEVFMLWSDRVLAITPEWDHELAVCAMSYPNRPFWMDSLHLAGAGQFILPPAWLAVCGQPCPGLYPFWFEDTHVEEMDCFVHGFPRVAMASKGAGPRGDKTNRCRDIAWWINFYSSQRDQRVMQAVQIAEKLGVPVRDNTREIAYFDARDREFLSRAPALEKQFGAVGPPDATYLEAKGRAQMILDELKVAA